MNVPLQPRHASLNRRRPAQQLRQLGDVGGDPPHLVAGEELGRRSPTGLLLAIDVGERLPVGVADAARTGGAPMLITVDEM